MPKYVVSTTLLGTETGRQPVSFPVEAVSENAALTVSRTKLGKIVQSGKASGYTTLRIKLADVQ